MKITNALLASWLLLSLTGLSEEIKTVNPNGLWKWESSYSDRVSILKLEYEGKKLTGVILREDGRETRIEDSDYANGRIAFKTTWRRGDRAFTTQYKGAVGKDSIKGTMEFQGSGERRARNWQAKRTLKVDFAPLTLPREYPVVEADIELNQDNYQVWRDHILPDMSEMAWDQIPWLPTFKDGVLAANAAAKPLLLWTMNGHPLGCT